MVTVMAIAVATAVPAMCGRTQTVQYSMVWIHNIHTWYALQKFLLYFTNAVECESVRGNWRRTNRKKKIHETYFGSRMCDIIHRVKRHTRVRTALAAERGKWWQWVATNFRFGSGECWLLCAVCAENRIVDVTNAKATHDTHLFTQNRPLYCKYVLPHSLFSYSLPLGFRSSLFSQSHCCVPSLPNSSRSKGVVKIMQI